MSRKTKTDNLIKKNKTPGDRKKSAAVKKVFQTVGTVLLVLIVAALCALPAVFMNSVYGYVPVMVLAFAIILSLLSLLILRYSLKMETSVADVECERGGSIDIGIKLRNNGIVASPKGIAKMFVTDLFGKTDSSRDVNFALAAKGDVDFNFGLDLKHIGLYKVGITDLKVYDLFGIAKFTLPVGSSADAVVLPKIREISQFHVVQNADAETDSETKATVVGGYDYTGVREYEPGDPMKQIHWKLSSPSNTDFTKMHESSRRLEFAVILDFAAQAADTETLMDMNDCLVEVAFSLINEIHKTDTSYNLMYADRDHVPARTARAGRDQFSELMHSFAGIVPDPEETFPDGATIMQMESKRHGRSTNVLVVTSRVTEQMLSELQNIMRQSRAPELYYIIPESWTSRDIENAAARLRVLDDMEIPYYMISTESNL